MEKYKKVLVLESPEGQPKIAIKRQIETARVLNGLTEKLSNRGYIGEPIRISLKEAELLNEIVVSSRPWKE